MIRRIRICLLLIKREKNNNKHFSVHESTRNSVYWEPFPRNMRFYCVIIWFCHNDFILGAFQNENFFHFDCNEQVVRISFATFIAHHPNVIPVHIVHCIMLNATCYNLTRFLSTFLSLALFQQQKAKIEFTVIYFVFFSFLCIYFYSLTSKCTSSNVITEINPQNTPFGSVEN